MSREDRGEGGGQGGVVLNVSSTAGVTCIGMQTIPPKWLKWPSDTDHVADEDKM